MIDKNEEKAAKDKAAASIMPGPYPPPPPYNEMREMGLRLIRMGVELLENEVVYPFYGDDKPNL